MNRLFSAVAAILLATIALASPAQAGVRVNVGLGLGVGCCWAAPWWGGPGYYYGPPAAYYPPPPVAYYPPPAAYYPPPAVAYAPPRGVVNAAPASPVYVDGYGRACREYQTTIVVGGATRPASGTACQQPDGSWQVVR